jgi:hypothetical protein
MDAERPLWCFVPPRFIGRRRNPALRVTGPPMNKRLIIFLIIAVVVAVAGYLIYSHFEIYPTEIPTPPLREVRINNFAALERWLQNTGRRFRVEKRGSPRLIASAPEKTVLAYASFCDWKNAGEILLPWIESGGNLIICLDDHYDKEDDISVFLSEMGIIIGDTRPVEVIEKPEETAEEIDEPEETAEVIEAGEVIDMSDEMEEITEADSDDESAESAADELVDETPVPNFDWDVCFLFADNAPAGKTYAIEDRRGLIRLVQIQTGEGTLTVIGRPVFMYNSRLDRENNASLAWSLTGARIDENSGLLFIRDRRVPRGLFGKLAERGNFTPLLVSVLLLIIAGFWMVIPLCGPVYSEKKTVARPLRQRFLAEIRFLKKHNALVSYLQVYLSWLKPKLTGASEESEIHYIEQALAHTDGRDAKPLKYRDIVKALRKIQTFVRHLRHC